MALSNEQWNAPAGGADFYEHQVANSVRTHFGDNDSSIKRTPSTGGNRATWSISIWMKRAHLGANQFIFESGASGNFDTRLFYLFAAGGGIEMSSGEVNYGTTTELFRDVGAWYHIFIKNVSNSNTIYVNGTLIKTTTLSGNTAINKASEVHGIGTRAGSGNGARFGGYIAEFLLFDGTAYAPTDVAESKNGVWIPKDPSGLTLNGENTTWLKFANSGALGTDSSGEGNTWTIGSAITAKDQMLDSPTFSTSEGNGGNFCTLNPLARNGGGTFTEGNLLFTHTDNVWKTNFGTMSMTSGKWYWEAYQIENLAGNGFPLGIYDMDSGLSMTQSVLIPGAANATAGTGYFLYSTGQTQYNNAESDAITDGAVGAAGDVWQCAFDADAGKLWFGKNDTWGLAGVGADPASGNNQNYASIPTGRNWVPGTCSYNDGDSENFPQNFGADGTFFGRITAQGNSDGNGIGNFKYEPPSGFLALCSANISVADAIDPAKTSSNFPQKLFNTKLYTGTGSSLALTGVGFQPDWVVVKERGAANDFKLTDSTRGVTTSLEFNETTAEVTEAQGLTAFGTDGFTVGTDVVYNNNTDTYLAWNWRANGGTTVTNEEGSIDSTVQADPSAGFSVVTWTGAAGSWGTLGTVGHGLSAAPTVIFAKRRDSASEWCCFFSDYGLATIGGSNAASNKLQLNVGDAIYTNQSYSDFGKTMPTADVFTVNGNLLNNDGNGAIAYCFTNTEGYIKSGVYEGNANADGAFVYTGFRPAFLIIKRVEGAESWMGMDDKRDLGNVVEGVMQLNGSNGESTTDYDALDMLSNGFKLRIANAGFNHAEAHVYIAFASNPFKYATAR